MIERQLAHYRILEKIGEGGMGEVWKALDTSLDREVAVKFLPDVFAADRERLERFEREAKLLATLNHPGIAAVYGLHAVPTPPEQAPATIHFIAMELVPGEDLAQRLERGPLAIDEAVDVARQIADALEAAHEQGVVHRDLKPANVKLTPEGKIKILDLGLAKALATDGSGDSAISASHSPTVTSAGTIVGTLLGTAAYMSPEQARGRAVDRRADIWAFGAVMFEMLTGRPMFGGETVTDVLAAVVREDPDWSRLPDRVPARIVGLLQRCLDRDVRRRLRDIGEARVLLEDPGAGDDTRTESMPSMTTGGVSWPLALAGAILLAVVSALVVGVWQPFAARPAAEDPLRLAFTLPAGRVLPWQFSRVDVSPDGRTVAYTALEAGVSRIHLRSLDAFETTIVAGTEGGSGAMFSPDGRSLAFFRGSDLYRISVEGGTSQLVAKGTVWDRDGAWLDDDTIVLGGRGADVFTMNGLAVLPAAGGAMRPLSEPTDEKDTHGAPIPLSDGTILFSVARDMDDRALARYRPDQGTWESLGIPGKKGWWLDSGYVVAFEDPGFKAYPFDLSSGSVLGDPVSLLHDAQGESLALSASGTAAYISRTEQGGGVVVAVSRDGTVTPLLEEAAAYRWPRVSPDGERLVIGVRGQKAANRLWVYELASGRRTPLGHPGENTEPVWSPDGLQVLMSGGSDADGLALQRADGSRPPVRLHAPEFAPWPTDWSEDGRYAVFYGSPADDLDIWILELDGDEPVARLAVGGPGHQRLAEFSPDGRWLAYSSNEGGRMSVYVQSFPQLDRRWTVSGDGGTDPKWSPDGREVYYRHEDGIYGVSVSAEGEDLQLGAPALLVSGSYAHDPNGDQSWDVMPDGRFVLILPEAQERRELRVVTNLGEEIRDALGND